MPIPKEFSYESEQDFTARLLIPLLTRLGYATVLNYHGVSEFGKDLIVGEFDRFSHARYHAIQVKYVDSIGLSASEDLIRDCSQAFKNPFRHPQTGESHFISSFYVINGGSFSDQAITHFFATTRPSYGDNARLLDGKALLQLDRSAAIVGVDRLRSSLAGVRLELFYNERAVSYICDALTRSLKEAGGFPMQRLRADAALRLLENPPAGMADDLALLQEYWQYVTIFNRIVDSVDVPVSGGGYRESRAEGAIGLKDKVLEHTVRLLPVIDGHLGTLGPVVGL
jgi:hypothetical protein